MQRHPLDLFSLLAGTVICAVAVLALTTGLDRDLVTSDVFWPIVLIGLGVVALAATLGTRRGDEPGGADDDSTATETSEPVES